MVLLRGDDGSFTLSTPTDFWQEARLRIVHLLNSRPRRHSVFLEDKKGAGAQSVLHL